MAEENEKLSGLDEINRALADADKIYVYGNAEGQSFSSLLSRLKTFISGWELISTQTPTNVATADITDLSDTYFRYRIEFMLTPATDSVSLNMRTSANNGTSFDTSGYQFRHSILYPTATAIGAGDAQGAIVFTSTEVGSDTNEDVEGSLILYNPAVAKKTKFDFEAQYINDAGSLRSVRGGGMRNSAAIVNAVRFYFSSGNIESGTIKVYGLRA